MATYEEGFAPAEPSALGTFLRSANNKTKYLAWASSPRSSDIAEPLPERMSSGWRVEQPTHAFFNWHMNRTDTRLTDAESRLNWLIGTGSGMYGVTGKVDTLLSTVGTNDTAANTLRKRVKDLETALASLTSRVAALEG